MAKQTITTVTEVKTYQCSDGKVYDNIDMAEAHEREIQDPNYALAKRVTSLEVDLESAKNKIILYKLYKIILFYIYKKA